MSLVNALGNLVMEGVTEQQIHQDEPRSDRLEPIPTRQTIRKRRMTVQTDITAETTSRFVDTRSYRMHYWEAGVGIPVIFLHGSGPGATGWSNFAPNIGVLARDYRVLAVDMPGWGRSETEDEGRGDDHVTHRFHGRSRRRSRRTGG
jgi:hypothetical protein